MSRVDSSFQDRLLGLLTSSAPVNLSGCHTPNAPPVGSMKTAIVPESATCIGGAMTWPPASVTFLAVSAASVVEMYVDQAVGCCGLIRGAIAATGFPS